jgi:hypothetical protein
MRQGYRSPSALACNLGCQYEWTRANHEFMLARRTKRRHDQADIDGRSRQCRLLAYFSNPTARTAKANGNVAGILADFLDEAEKLRVFAIVYS